MFAGPVNAGAGALEEPDCEPELFPPVGPEEPSEPAFAGVLNLSGSVKNCLTAPAA